MGRDVYSLLKMGKFIKKKRRDVKTGDKCVKRSGLLPFVIMLLQSLIKPS